VEDSTCPLPVSAVYLPPKHTVKQVQLAAFYSTLGRRFIAGGDYSAEHTYWGSRQLITPRGREILRTMEQLNLYHLSIGEPTYCPSDRNTLPDLLDFCVIKGFPHDSALNRPCFDLASDHSLRLISLNFSVHYIKHLYQMYVIEKLTGTTFATSSLRTSLSMCHSKQKPKLKTRLSTSLT
jgi:hypothetical protein